jgi:mannose-6-phosphate isomerase-like protein (cupin superfamily)
MSFPAPYTELLEAIAAVYRAEGRPEGPATAQALLATPQPTPVGHEVPCPFDAQIRACLAASQHPLAKALLAAQAFVPWGVNPVADRMTGEAAAVIAVSTLMGPDGPILSPDYRLGLVYMAPFSYYGLHNHDADETYVLIAGAARWTAGDDICVREAGSMVHHPSHMGHAFRTGPDGFVALWRWSGDINTHSYAFLPDPEVGAA